MGGINASASGFDASDTGFAGMASSGYELSIVRTVTLSPQVDYLFIAVGEGVTADAINVSLGINWYGWSDLLGGSRK